jgi:hypothetical protein
VMVPVVARAGPRTPERGKPRGSVSPLGVIPFRSTLRPTGRSRRRPKPLADGALPVRSQPESRFRWPLAGGPPPLAGGGPVGRSGNLAEPGPDPCGPVAAESVSLSSSEGNVGTSRRARLPDRLDGFRGRVRSFAFPRDPARAGWRRRQQRAHNDPNHEKTPREFGRSLALSGFALAEQLSSLRCRWFRLAPSPSAVARRPAPGWFDPTDHRLPYRFLPGPEGPFRTIPPCGGLVDPLGTWAVPERTLRPAPKSEMPTESPTEAEFPADPLENGAPTVSRRCAGPFLRAGPRSRSPSSERKGTTAAGVRQPKSVLGFRVVGRVFAPPPLEELHACGLCHTHPVSSGS